MSFFISIFLVWCLLGVAISVVNINKVKFARETVELVFQLHRYGLINDIQAKVFLNDMEDPLNTAAIQEVRWQLDDIIKMDRINGNSSSANR